MPEATVAAIITNTHQGIVKLLLTRRANNPFRGEWCLPGGHIDGYETARDAAVREVREETGLDFKAHFFGSFDEIIPNQDIHAVVSVFTGEGTGVIEPQPGEIQEIQWFSLAEALSMPLAFAHHHILEAYVSGLTQPRGNEPKPGMLEEYAALRSEILERVKMRQQILTFTLVIGGTFLTLGVQFDKTLALLIFPVLATLLALLWVQSDVRAGEIGEYIRANVESHLDGVRWETHIRQKYASQKLRSAEVSAFWVFWVTEIFSILIAAPKLVFSIEETALVILDIVSLVITLFVIQRRRGMFYLMKKGRKAA
jgi:8-oxo-dGTP diphosphatase